MINIAREINLEHICMVVDSNNDKVRSTRCFANLIHVGSNRQAGHSAFFNTVCRIGQTIQALEAAEVLAP